MFSVRPEVRKPKKTPINPGMAIENLGLSGGWAGFNLQLSDFSGANRVTSPGKNWEQSLASTALRDDSSLRCEARWHGPHARHQPRSGHLPGVFLFQMTRCAKKALIFGGQA
jgi:hypothetical protein